MEYKTLGRTGFKVSILGIGNEYLKKLSTDEITHIYSLALSEGVNYFDLVWSLPNIIYGLGIALTKQKTEAVLAFHLGSCVSNGNYKRSRNPSECEKHLRLQLEQLNLDFAPVLTIHYVPTIEVWQDLKRKGIISLAQKLKQENLAKALSVSTHDPEVIKLAAESGIIDCIMHQINIANDTYTARNDALHICSNRGVAVIAMKPFAGGELLKVGRKVIIPEYKTGWKKLTVKVPRETTSTKLLSYALNQPAVCTAVMGVTSIEELTKNLSYLQASNQDKDYTPILQNLKINE